MSETLLPNSESESSQLPSLVTTKPQKVEAAMLIQH